MKNLPVVLFLISTATFAFAEDPVNFPDANLKAAVEQRLKITDPKPNDMLGLTRLYASESNISDLRGIEYATNLSLLYLSDNQISDLSPLSGLTHLDRLW